MGFDQWLNEFKPDWVNVRLNILRDYKIDPITAWFSEYRRHVENEEQLKRLKYETKTVTINIPQEVLEAEKTIVRFFDSLGITNWKLGRIERRKDED